MEDPTKQDVATAPQAATRGTPEESPSTKEAGGKAAARRVTETTRPNQQLLAYALIALGAVLLLTRLGGADWLWLALLSGAFLLGYVSRKNYGFLVAGVVLMGVAVGTLIDTQSGMLLSLAAGFFAIDRIEPRPNRWALYAAGIFAVLGALGALSVTGLLGSVGFALVLIAAGTYLLLRDRQPRFPPRDTYQPTSTKGTGTNTTYTGETYTSPHPPTATTPVNPEPAVVPTTPTPAARAATTPASQKPTLTDSSRPAPEPTPIEPTPEAIPEVAPPPLSPEAEARLRRLEAWRRETAAAEGTPAYIVFSNDTLAKIAAAEPRTLAELDTVKGVGPVKLERYGEAVLALIRGAPEPTETR